MALVSLAEIERTGTVVLAGSKAVGIVVVNNVDVRVAPVCA